MEHALKLAANHTKRFENNRKLDSLSILFYSDP